MKHLKQVIKGNTKLSDIQFKRHLLLAYQWIKRQDLTKAENPLITRKCIRVNLLIELINFFSKNKVSFKEMNEYLKNNNYKVKIQSFDHFDMVEYFNHDRNYNPIFNNYYFVKLHPDIEKLDKTPIPWIINFLFREILINPEIITNNQNESFILNFKNLSGSCLSLSIPQEFIHKTAIQFSFVLLNKVQSSGVLVFDRDSNAWGHPENKIFNSMIKELLQQDKEGVKNENK